MLDIVQGPLLARFCAEFRETTIWSGQGAILTVRCRRDIATHPFWITFLWGQDAEQTPNAAGQFPHNLK